jgi:hypothetical protein
MCALNVARWSDRQLDELKDMLASADNSKAALFVVGGFLATGSKVMTDATDTTLRVTANVPANGGIKISSGVFIHNSKVGQLDATEYANVTKNEGYAWGAFDAPDADPRWDLICVCNAELSHTQEDRWFVNDAVSPNTYATAPTNTLINKAYYDIQVVHGTAAPVPTFPAVPAGYFCIAEIYIPAGVTNITNANIYDTGGTSQSAPLHWDTSTRVLRLEYGASAFKIDHDPATGFHRLGTWHIGAVPVTVTATEINQALKSIGGTVTAANLTKLTDTTTLPAGTLHSHAGGPRQYIHMTEECAPGLAGFNIVHNTWTTRRLNVIRCDDTGSVSLVVYQFTLPAGTYILDAITSAHDSAETKARLYNVTDAGIMPNGQTDTSGRTMVGGVTDNLHNNLSHVRGKFTIAAPKLFELQSWQKNDGWTGDAYSGDGVNNEIWAEVVFWKC